jgi:site-specific DNA-methyltransferase (adenine-specific)
MSDLQIETVKIETLAFDPTNARKHDAKNLDAIAGSLKLFGQRKPIVVTPDNVVVAGNGTLAAAKSLGWTEIVIARTPRGWTWEQIKAFALADNRTAELAEWDSAVLANQLLELDAVGWDLAEFGFEPLEPPASPDDDDEPLSFDDAPTRAKLGDHWVIGKHHIICGDSTDLNLIKRFGTSFDAVVTDPPYGIGAGSWTRLGKGRINNNVSEWDNSKPPIAWILDLAPKAIIWGGNYFTDELPVTNDWLCWHKKNDDRTFSEFELAWTNLGKQCRHLSHHWSGEQKQHMTMKPSPVMDWCVKFIEQGSKILDVFAGSGSTILAADRNKQIGYGVELDPKYVDVILDRLEKQTGLEAQLIED